ncbi:MAG: glycerophosphodiester phosphodiesterase family protein [Bacteroidota bacterium]
MRAKRKSSTQSLTKVICFGIVLTSLVSLTANAQVKNIAHRGASSIAPENTLAAFRMAAEVGADYFELDVMLSKDDSLVIIHDNTLDRTTDGTGAVNNYTYEQLSQLDAGSWFSADFEGEKIPTLRESLLQAREDGIKVCIEAKTGANGMAGKIVNLVEELGMENEVIIFCFDLAVITESKTINPQIPVLLLTGAITNGTIDQVESIQGEAIGGNGGATTAILDYAHARDIEVWRWTVNSESEMVSLIDLGIDGIITNFPQKLVALDDDTPPSNVVIESAVVEATSVMLSWQAAEDAESGISGYEIYRSTSENASTLYATVGDALSFTDETLQEEQTFYYRIKAKNRAGMASVDFSNEVIATTQNDVTPPEVTSVYNYGDHSEITVSFNEIITQSSAEDISNYTINGIEIHSSQLSIEKETVSLTTSALLENTPYTLHVKGIEDGALTPNPITDTAIDLSYQPYFDGLVAHWPLDETGGDTIYDHSGNDNHGWLVSNPEWTEGKIVNAMKFDGVEDYVQIPLTGSLNITTSAVSMSTWVKLSYLPGEMPSTYGPVYDSDSDCYIIYEDANNNELRFKVATSGGAERPGINSSRLRTGEWIHVVGVYDGSQASIYMNGVVEDTHTGLSGTVKPNQSARMGENGGHYFKGGVDDLQIYNRALTDKEIQFLYEAKSQACITGIQAGPKLDNAGFEFSQNHPNPFSTITHVSLSVPKDTPATLTIYNLAGKKVLDVVDRVLSAGDHMITINASQLTNGVYFYRLETPGLIQTKSMVVIK